MDLYSKVTKEVDALPDGPQIGAFFDFDGTVIYGYSATTYLREQIKRGDVSPRQLLELTKTMTQFGMGNMGFSAMMTIASQYLRGISEEDYLEFAEKLYTKHIAKLIYPETRALIEAHLKKGHTVALVTAATPYQVMPAARDLGVENVKCSNLEVVDGKFTGSVVKPTCYGMGKVDAAEQIAEQYDVDLSQSYFYSDSDEDIQLLEFVGKPRPLNPNKRLRRIASGRGWPVQDFNSRGNASVFDYLKTAATQVSMLTSFAAGLPIYALTGSLNKSRNFSTSLFADTACALTGIELDVEGEENAWANRPCVFVFNHQSQADVIILPALLRRDLAGIGKKEIGNVPILGKLMQIGGTVLIDRENAASALEAMKPLVDVLQKEGRSVCVAPEGTRSTSTHLGRFKKGAFHLAMQAGVPIVPIVIHNAIDVAPRGQYVFRPATVKITVLPAVDTSHWSSETMNQHVDDVRDMFLEELDQMRFQISDQERAKTELRLKNLQRKEAANKRAKKKSAAAKLSTAVKATAKPAKLKAVIKKTVSATKAVINSDDDAIKATPVSRKVKAVETKRAPRRRSRKVSTAKVSARTLDS
jgi:putative phosphoserine phosphatase/1-acylglycerol-3-phosphate O-acyltransferase